MKNFTEKYNVSRETLEDLKTYQKLLFEWQKKFNLVSNSSLQDAWKRHFEDSAQLYKYIPENAKSLVDFGSGAGFPGLVLAIMAKSRTPYLKITLVESIRKKTLFLNEVASRVGLGIKIENRRIENLSDKKFDVITSRAMCSLEKLLGYSSVFCRKNTVCIFPKGKTYEEELLNAKKTFSFNYTIENNLLSDEGKILIISNISKKGESNA